MFDDSLLDDETALRRHDLRLRHLAEAGSRVRRDVATAAEAVGEGARRLGGTRPRAVLAAGPDSRLLRAVLEPWCPVPFVAWPAARLPGWAGSLDLVVVLAPDGNDPDSVSAVVEAMRRGCTLVVVTPERSLVGENTGGRDTVLLPTVALDPLGTAVVALDLLRRWDLAPDEPVEAVADALDEVAVACSPYRDLAVNPGKTLASSIADTTPLCWGGTVLAARAARRVAEAVRRATGRAAVAGDADQVLPVLEQAVVLDPFYDPLEDLDGGRAPSVRPSLVVLEDPTDDPVVTAARTRMVVAADARGVRVEVVSAPERGDAQGSVPAMGGVARYAALVATGEYAAAYLAVGEP